VEVMVDESTDIVASARWYVDHPPWAFAKARPIILGLVDEVERLRKENKRLRETAGEK